MNLLFLNVGRRCELVQAFRRALGSRGGGVIIGTDISPLAPARQAVDAFHLLPRTDESSFVHELSTLVDRYRLDLLIPTIDPDLERLDRQRQAIARACPRLRLLLSPGETIRLCGDKRLSTARFRELGARVPRQLSLTEALAELPVFVKPPRGSASEGCARILDASRLRERLAADPELMVEAIVEGPETTVDVLCDLTGRALVAVPRRRLQVRGGEVSRSIVERDPSLERLACRLAEGFGAIGPVTVQVRQPATGPPVAMEMNARVGGGLPLTIAAGADWPGMVLDMVQAKPVCPPELCNHLVMSRYDRSLFLPPPRARRVSTSVLGAVRALIFDLDDTLYPETDFVLGGYRAVARRVWEDHGLEIEGGLRARFLSGERGDLFSPALLAAGLEPEESYVRQLVDVYRTHTPQLQPYLDTGWLTRCREAGLRLGLVSDGLAAVQQRKWQALGLAALFDTVVFSDSLGGRDCWKPSTLPFEACLQGLGLPPDQACYVADNASKDFLGPRCLGMPSLQLARPDGLHAALPAPAGGEADGIIASLAELPDFLRPLQCLQTHQPMVL